MNIHEYQAKELFRKYSIPVENGVAVSSAEEFNDAINSLNGDEIVVKSQIHAGGRGKGVFKDGYQGGVKLCSKKDAATIASKMLGNVLVTKQTGADGKLVQKIYFDEKSDIKKEYYLAILMDRKSAGPVIIASTEGGMDIEKVAAESPEKIVKVFIDPLIGLKSYHILELCFGLGFTDKAIQKQFAPIISNLYKLFWEKDCSILEINPFVSTSADKFVALDAKMVFDDNALMRHPEILELRDTNEEDPKEVEASKHSLNYIAFDGDIACMVNGAGLAMSTMDIIKHFNGTPANFLDVGGSANEEQISSAFDIISSDPHVKGILINIFGGIMKCDIIAKGIIAALKGKTISLPLVVRLEGTNVEEGKRLLAESGLNFAQEDTLSSAAQTIVNLVNKGAK